MKVLEIKLKFKAVGGKTLCSWGCINVLSLFTVHKSLHTNYETASIGYCSDAYKDEDVSLLLVDKCWQLTHLQQMCTCKNPHACMLTLCGWLFILTRAKIQNPKHKKPSLITRSWVPLAHYVHLIESWVSELDYKEVDLIASDSWMETYRSFSPPPTQSALVFLPLLSSSLHFTWTFRGIGSWTCSHLVVDSKDDKKSSSSSPFSFILHRQPHCDLLRNPKF